MNKVHNLQTRIEARATQQAQNEFYEFKKFMERNQFARHLCFVEDTKKYDLFRHVFPTALMHGAPHFSAHLNFTEAKEKCINYYIEQETEKILKAVDEIGNYIDLRNEENHGE